MNYLKKAGNIHRKVIYDVKKVIKPEVTFLEVFEFIENRIIDLGGKPAFPPNISINEIAAHDTAFPDDRRIINEGDVVKIDIGVHIDGWIVDGAITIEVNDNKYKELIKICEVALKNAIKTIKKDIQVSYIGEVIESSIKPKGYNPIYNLFGHKIERYNLHAGLNIPNYNNGSKIKIDKGVYAIEPFATMGSGYVKDSRGSTIYSIVGDIKSIRLPSARKFLYNIYNEFKTLPFSKLQIIRRFNNNYNIDYMINYLKSHGVLYEYSVLVESSGGVVVQSETTVFVDNFSEDLIKIYTLD